jgi:hypothetical protein
MIVSASVVGVAVIGLVIPTVFAVCSLPIGPLVYGATDFMLRSLTGNKDMSEGCAGGLGFVALGLGVLNGALGGFFLTTQVIAPAMGVGATEPAVLVAGAIGLVLSPVVVIVILVRCGALTIN